mgnify:CR=1 FL=1
MPRSRSRTCVKRKSRSPRRVASRRRRCSPGRPRSSHRHHSGRHLRRHSPVRFSAQARCDIPSLNSGEDWEEKCDAKPGCSRKGQQYCYSTAAKAAQTAQEKMAGATRLAQSKMHSAQQKAQKAQAATMSRMIGQYAKTAAPKASDYNTYLKMLSQVVAKRGEPPKQKHLDAARLMYQREHPAKKTLVGVLDDLAKCCASRPTGRPFFGPVGHRLKTD